MLDKRAFLRAPHAVLLPVQEEDDGLEGYATTGEAAQYFNAVLSQVPHHLEAMLGRAKCYELDTDWANAMESLNQACPRPLSSCLAHVCRPPCLSCPCSILGVHPPSAGPPRLRSSAWDRGDVLSSQTCHVCCGSSGFQSPHHRPKSRPPPQVVARNNWFVPALVDKAKLLLSMNDWENALDTLNRVLQNDSSNIDAMLIQSASALTPPRAPFLAFHSCSCLSRRRRHRQCHGL